MLAMTSVIVENVFLFAF